MAKKRQAAATTSAGSGSIKLPDAMRKPATAPALADIVTERITEDGLAALRSSIGLESTAELDLTPAEAIARRLIEPDFDRDYYFLMNEDVRRAGKDPLLHFLRNGRHENRKPVRWFDPDFYVAAYPDAQVPGMDPFSHYLRFGRAEGRHTCRLRADEFRALDQARAPTVKQVGWGPETVCEIKPALLQDLLRECLEGSRGLTLSISHDRYLDSVGGIQVLIADEQSAFNARGETYIHLCPAVPLLTLAAEDSASFYLNVAINGSHAGITTGAELLRQFAQAGPYLPASRRLVVHCLFGHRIGTLVQLYRYLQPADAVFWVHDYETICIGYNLLRNDVAFCGAPPIGSPACGVCVYGTERESHLAGIRSLFDSIPFHVAAPSSAALAIWLSKANLPHLSAQVHPTVTFEATSTRRRMPSASERGAAGNPVRIAFVGYPAVHKGWEAFAEIAGEIGRSGAFRLFHFSGSSEARLPGVELVPTRVLPSQPDAMVKAVAAAGIDLVLILSPWPETFCIVANEVLAGGADILTLEQSGNVPNLVRRTGRGMVFEDVPGMLAFLTSLRAIQYVRMRRSEGVEMGRTRFVGVTASLAIPAPALHQVPEGSSRNPVDEAV